MMDKELKISQLKSVESLGFGSVTANIVFVDEWWDYSKNDLSLVDSPSLTLLLQYISRSQLDQSKIYVTCAEKRWMHSEDEWHEALAMELSLIRPRMVVSLGNRRVKKILLKIKDLVPDFKWFTEIHNHHVIKRFYHDDEFYIQQLNQLARDYQYDAEIEDEMQRKTHSFS